MVNASLGHSADEFTLNNILGKNHENLEDSDNKADDAPADEEIPQTAPAKGYCVECEGPTNCPFLVKKNPDFIRGIFRSTSATSMRNMRRYLLRSMFRCTT
jgi:hypothetical protein